MTIEDAPDPRPRLWDRLSGKIGVILTGAVTFSLLITPVSTQGTDTVDGVSTTETMSLIQSEGWGIAVVLMVPLLLALVAAFGRGFIAATGLVMLAVLVILALPTIGLFYIPGLIALGIAFFRSRRSARDAGAAAL
ncbi:MAG: hypothetical protein HKN07_06990 [Acidimicrobiia bacterium]|nr:hypothetical protein [Acidimicrobiia bacterium]NNF63990.1 hypothetical protein [Acidimicrobiia bacterium]